jgi:diguanylate cyclase (GGDEF)-like protein
LPQFLRHTACGVDGVPVPVEAAFDACTFRHHAAFQIVLRTPGAKPAVSPAYMDRLTFRDDIARAIAASDESGASCAVMVLGIDGFPAVASAHGFGAAEDAFEEATRRLIESVRRGDAIASVGLHEHAILLGDFGDGDIGGIAQRKLEVTARPVAIGNALIFLTASIGVAVLSHQLRAADELIASANRALLEAREAGGNCVRIHDRMREDEDRVHAVAVPETSRRLARLTPRERQVLDMLVVGNASKMIAYNLGTSARTIDQHRARVMQKMQADSMASLVTMTLQART